MRIDIHRLTVLAGANSSGKSSFIQPLLLLKQTLEAPFDPGPLRISGPNVIFTSAEQFLSRTFGSEQANHFRIIVEEARQRNIAVTFTRDPKGGVTLVEMIYRRDGEQITLEPDMPSEQIMKQLATVKDYAQMYSFLTSMTNSELKVSRNRCFFDLQIGRGGIGASLALPGEVPLLLSQMIHVPGLRGNPERTYKTSAVAHEFPGLFNDYVASIIHYWKGTGDDRLKRLATSLKDLGLTWKVDTRQVDDTQVEVRVGRLPQGRRGGALDMVNIADVGFGVSQSLPVVVALLAAQPGQLVYIEQPEIHLHPRAQVKLATLLIQAAKRNVRVVVETHSGLLILGLQALVAEGGIDPGHVALHWFTRRTQDGATQVVSGTMDRRGAYGDWPIDFGEIELELQDRYLSVVERAG